MLSILKDDANIYNIITLNFINMKKLLLLILFFIPICLSSQDRINRVLPTISPNILSEIDSAKGWMIQKYGEWLSGDNLIPKQLSMENKQFARSKAFCIDNFYFYQFRELNINNKNYIVLIKKSEAPGTYKYPTIREGFSIGNRINYAVFEKKDYQTNISTIKDNTINIIKIPLSCPVGVINASDDLDRDISIISEKIVSSIDKETDDFDKLDFIIQVAPYKEKNIVQFLIYAIRNYDSFNSLEFLYNYINSDDEDFYRYFGENELFDYCYYEIDYNTFNNFIDLHNYE